jgi:hypothetical protein
MVFFNMFEFEFLELQRRKNKSELLGIRAPFVVSADCSFLSENLHW